MCSIEGCDYPVLARGWCSTHYTRWRKNGDPDCDRRLGAQPGERRAWVGDAIRYKGAHTRVRRARGVASSYTCAHCGETAAEWAYDRTDPNPLVDEYRGFQIEYSGNPNRYMPLCISCHRKYDLKVKV